MQQAESPQILIIADDRIGSYSQLIGLAQSLKLSYEIINIKYNCFGFLPNWLLPSKSFIFDKISKEKLSKVSFIPRFIFSAGRRSAMAALYLQEKLAKKPKIIQLMNPNLSFCKFFAVILPKHDFTNLPHLPKNSNIILTTGSLTKINQEAIKLESEKFKQIFAVDGQIKDASKKIALLIGGSSRNSVFDEESALKLTKIVNKIAIQMKAMVIVLTSRRTGNNITNIVRNNLHCENKFFIWTQIKENNPYLAILGNSDFFIVTADSTSMCSECCSIGKPVYIFDNKNLATKKHRLFHEDLFKNNYARKLKDDLITLENFYPKKLSETKRVADIITNFKLN
jgi:mitochondrial fission protein ELM1